MKKFWTNKTKLLLGLSLLVGSVGITVPFIVSCSNNGVGVSTRTFDVKQQDGATLAADSTTKAIQPNETFVYDAKHNTNAQNELRNLRKYLSAKELQVDFNRVLTKFYECYEKETNKYEYEIESIRVANKNPDDSFKLEVFYKVENDDTETEEILTASVNNWNPKFTFLTKDDENQIRNMVKNYDGDADNGMDLGDLKEIFLGEHDYGEQDDDKDYDDYGIFDRLRMINKDNYGKGAMVAYELSIADIFDHLSPNGSKKVPTKDTKFRIPSIALNGGGSLVLIPNIKPRISSSFRDFTIEQLDTMFASRRDIIVAEEIQAELDKLFLDPIDAAKMNIQEINYFPFEVDNETQTKSYKLRIIYQNQRGNSDLYYTCDVFYINPPMPIGA